jgi:hypothetical protein
MADGGAPAPAPGSPPGPPAPRPATTILTDEEAAARPLTVLVIGELRERRNCGRRF